jgi:alkylhydroperoxidase family enzyme
MDDPFAELRNATAAALLRAPAATPEELRVAVSQGKATPELRALVEMIRTRAYTVTDRDLDALRKTFTEDQLFEIIVAAAFGAAEERLTSALHALEEA